LSFEIVPPDVDEASVMTAGGEPPAVAAILAQVKAHAVATQHPDSVVLAADTIVTIDGRMLGKPTDASEAFAMLSLLRGRTHKVVTGVAVIGPEGVWADADSSSVRMRAYSETEIEASIARSDPFDKAGAYAIQDTQFCPVKELVGCLDNVIGLSLAKAVAGMAAFGVAPEPEALSALPDNCKRCLADAGIAET
jgi:MAF protein